MSRSTYKLRFPEVWYTDAAWKVPVDHGTRCILIVGFVFDIRDDLEIGLNKPVERTAGGRDSRRLHLPSDPADLPIRPDSRVDSDFIDNEFEF